MMLATHPDADHIGDLAVVAQEFRPKVAYSDDVGTTKTYGRFIAALRGVHTRIASVFRGQTLRLGTLTAEVLNPAHDGSDTNADSIVLLLTIDGHEVLLTGDDYGPSEDYVADVVARGPPLYLLKVAHHGFSDATSAGFVAAIHPQFAVISAGPDSGSPPPATTILNDNGATVYSTFNNGTITVDVQPSGEVTWSFSKGPTPLVGVPRVRNAAGNVQTKAVSNVLAVK
jgi:beta-lactamase superfamily II metal-dependent hydrolase